MATFVLVNTRSILFWKSLSKMCWFLLLSISTVLKIQNPMQRFVIISCPEHIMNNNGQQFNKHQQNK